MAAKISNGDEATWTTLARMARNRSYRGRPGVLKPDHPNFAKFGLSQTKAVTVLDTFGWACPMDVRGKVFLCESKVSWTKFLTTLYENKCNNSAKVALISVEDYLHDGAGGKLLGKRATKEFGDWIDGKGQDLEWKDAHLKTATEFLELFGAEYDGIQHRTPVFGPDKCVFVYAYQDAWGNWKGGVLCPKNSWWKYTNVVKHKGTWPGEELRYGIRISYENGGVLEIWVVKGMGRADFSQGWKKDTNFLGPMLMSSAGKTAGFLGDGNGDRTTLRDVWPTIHYLAQMTE